MADALLEHFIPMLSGCKIAHESNVVGEPRTTRSYGEALSIGDEYSDSWNGAEICSISAKTFTGVGKKNFDVSETNCLQAIKMIQIIRRPEKGK